MKKNKVSMIVLALTLGAVPAICHAQTKRPQQPQTPVIGDTTLQKWDDSTNAKAMGDVVVVAYGAQKKTSVTGAVAQISEAQIAKRPLTNIAEALTGAAPGIQSTLRCGALALSPPAAVR